MKKSAFGVLTALTLALTLVPTTFAAQPQATGRVDKGDYNSYVVIMKSDPLAVTHGDNVNSANAKARGQALKASHNKTVKDAGLSTTRITNDYTVALNGFSANVTHAQAEKLAADKDVLFVLPDLLRQPMTDESGDFLGLTGSGGAYQQGLKGDGVVVGIIDTGIWPEHPSFADNGLPAPTGVASGIPCEFGNTGTANIAAGPNGPPTAVPHNNPNDAPFTCNDKLVGARQMLASYRTFIGADPDEFDSARDDAGHGTHTASTAAGNAGVQAVIQGVPVGDGTISGIAPNAHIIAYKGLGNGGGFTSDLAAAINQAVADGVDVINYSIGGGGGTLGADDIAFLFANDAGVFVASSAGNNGPNAGTIGSPGDDPWLVGVGASTQTRFFQGTVELGNGATYTGSSLTDGVGTSPLVDSATLGNQFCNPAVAFSASVAGKIVLCERGGGIGRIAKGQKVFASGGVGMIMFEQSDNGSLFTDTHWLPTVQIDNTPGLAIKAYIAANPGTATAKLRNTRTLSTWPIAPSMTEFSSRGPANFPDLIKPDVTAPGLQILAGYSPFPDAIDVPGQQFAAIAGTSMSSPHVAGLLALMKQYHPDWSPSAAKSALMTTAHQNVLDNNRTSAADPFDMGAGHVNMGRPNHKGTAFQPGLVYDTDLVGYIAWICGARPANVNPATCASLAGAGISLDPSDLNIASIAVSDVPGQQVVKRTITSVAQENGWRTYNASVVAPAGYSVSVSPSTVKLKSGQSADVLITITNNSAAIGAWQFGSLTWNDTQGHYSVRSPIAVKGSLINVPAEVSGSYQVQFGYTGPFSATARGLVPAQTFTDAVNTGDFICHNVVVPAGTTYARFQTFDANTTPSATTDIDLYVFRLPAGTQVGASGGGTTEEVVNLVNPTAATYAACLDGFATSNPSTTTLFAWVLGSTAAGNMTVTAPASAVNATTGNINLSFSGLTPGVKYLGSVVYSGVPGLPPPTIVRVNP